MRHQVHILKLAIFNLFIISYFKNVVVQPRVCRDHHRCNVHHKVNVYVRIIIHRIWPEVFVFVKVSVFFEFLAKILKNVKGSEVDSEVLQNFYFNTLKL